jgi:septal ring factor EnvC (AmiA/AmiB activator)
VLLRPGKRARGKENRLNRSSQFVIAVRVAEKSEKCSLFFRAYVLSVFLALLAVLTHPALAAKPKNMPPPAADEVAEKQNDLKDLRGQIEGLRKDMANAESTRADAADQLTDAEREISATQRELHGLAINRKALQSTMKNLGAQSRELAVRLRGQQSQLEKLIYRQYLQGNPDSLRLVLSGNDPNQLARDLHYLAAIGRARGHLLREIESTLQHKQALAANTRERTEQLANIERMQQEQHSKLLAQREQRKTTLVKISTKIADQRREIGSLERDEKRLSQLIERVARIIAEKAVPYREPVRKEKEHVKQATPTPHVEAEPPTERRAPAEIDNERAPEAISGGNFGQMKGKLRLPSKGKVSNRFGSPRQEGSTWRGLFIRAATGSEVKSIAGGRVVFADWMRGFGNLLIVDHGNSYLSIYGNNDSLLKEVGEVVRGGDTVASVGNSGGNPESGLYFELRHQGQPLDPLKWVNIR